MARQSRASRARRPPEPLIYAPLLSLDQDAIRALGKRGNGNSNLKALSTGDDSALEGLSYLEDLDVVDLVDTVDAVDTVDVDTIEEPPETPLPFHEAEEIGTARELGELDENTGIPVNMQTGIQENKITNIQEYPQTSLPENMQTGITVNLSASIQPGVEPGNLGNAGIQEYKNTSNMAVWPDMPIRGRRGSLQPLPGKIHWERRSNRTYRIDAETHDLVGDAATVVQRRAGYKLTRDDIAEWALRYAARDILARGMMSDILRDLLSPVSGSERALQFDDPGDDPTGIQENKNTGNPVNMNTRLPYVDSINHPSVLSSLTEGDESSRDRENKFTSIPAGLPDSAELEQWKIFIQDFALEIPGDQAEKGATAHQLAQIRRRSGLSIEVFAEALYEARDRFRAEGNKAKLRNPWAFFIDRLQLTVGA
ncbi:MAG: hypothetical protein IVW55_03580 [Chloroflexi bacterium]|nr:hypothetical protein [Chloroflexota bacterium]